MASSGGAFVTIVSLVQAYVTRRVGVVPKAALCCKVAYVVAPESAGVGVILVDGGLGALWATQVRGVSGDAALSIQSVPEGCPSGPTYRQYLTPPGY